MRKFNYTAKNADGGLIRDMIEADSRQNALADLRKRGLTVVGLMDVETVVPDDREPGGIKPDKNRISGMFKRTSDDLTLAPKKTPRVKKIRLSEMSIFCRQLAVSVNSGLPLREALEGIYEDMDEPSLKIILGNIIKKLHDGIPFSKAVAAHPKVFSPVFIGMIQAAEEAGSLAETLNRLAGYMESSDKLQRKVKSMLAYPAFVAGFFVVICLIMMFTIIPRFEEIFSGLGAKLPALTRSVFGLNRFILQNSPFIVVFVMLLAGIYILLKRTPAGRWRIDAAKLKIPVIGIGLKRYIIARICRCTAIMLKSGVPIATTLKIVAAIGDNEVIEAAILHGQTRIISGSSIADGLRETAIFPALLIRMLRVGESAGQLPDVMDRVADVYEDQVESSVVAGTALLEPIIITVFGLMVLVLVLSIYLPVFTVSSSIR
jgi:type IV pilus assembly protein PilC